MTSWLKQSENRPILVVAIITGILTLLASLLGKAYWTEKQLQQKAQAAVTQAEATALLARQEANKGERAREQAGDLVSYIMEDLNDALIPIGQAEVLESVAQQALSYFENLPPDLITPETENQQASVWESLANARYSQGDFKTAIAAREKANRLYRKLHTIDPGSSKIRTQLIHSLNELGILFNAAARTDEARAVYLQSRDLTPPEDAASLANIEFGLGEVERIGGQLELALVRYAKTSSLIRSALKEEPENILWGQTLMTCHNNAGLAALHLGQDQEAEQQYHLSLEAARKLVALEPKNRHWQKELATLLNNFGMLLVERQEVDRAEPFLQEALKLRQSLVMWDPKNTRWLLNLANSWHNDASLHFHRKNKRNTLLTAQKCLRIFQKLLTLEPGNTVWMDEMMSAQKINRKRLLELNDSSGALSLIEETKEFLAKLRDGQQETLAWNQTIAGLHRQIGQIQSERGDASDGAHQHRLAAEAYATEITDDASKKEALRQLAESYLDLGQALGKSPDAVFPFALAEFIFTEMLTEETASLQRLRDFAARQRVIATQKLPTTYLKAGSVWKYWDHREAPAPDWTQPSFDDSQWQEGPAPLGYGDGDEATEIRFGSYARNKRITAWFRHRFQVNDPASIEALQFNLRRDDGALVFLNGHEVIRDGLPNRKINPTTVAEMAKGFDERVFHRFQVPATQLQKDNIIAIEVHQNEPQSSDLTLDLEIWNAQEIPDLYPLLNLKKLKEVIGKKSIPSAVLKTLPQVR